MDWSATTRKSLRNESELNKGPHSRVQDGVVDVIDVLEVINLLPCLSSE